MSKAATYRALRKEQLRLEMESQRQLIRYHAQPITSPLRRISHAWENRRNALTLPKRTPLMIGAALALRLFSKRLGLVGKAASLALTFYPLLQKLNSLRHESQSSASKHITD